MNNEQFEALASRLEDQAQRNPIAYQCKVLLLALLGDVYLAIVLLLIVVFLAVLLVSIAVLKALALKLILVVGFFLWMILRALWVKVEPPTGIAVKAGQVPSLFLMIEELRNRLSAPRVHHVLITDDLNAGVVQTPRLGLFGWDRNYLVIGLPLMKSLTVAQFKAVLAHEFGHLARGHGRTSNWIYRQRLRWNRLMAVLDANESKGSFLFSPFLNWFTPYFNAFSFPLARANEYQADATSIRLTSPRTAAEALTGVNIIGSYLSERYWPRILQHADEQPQPCFTPYFSMGHRLAVELDDTTAQGWLDHALARQPTFYDTHPTLSERLKAIGEPPQLAPPAPDQAADRLLGEALQDITACFDRRWQDNILPAWQERHRHVQEGRCKLAELNERHAHNPDLSLQDAYERARLTEAIGGDAEAALSQFHTLHARAPDDAIICLALGARLLARNDDSGCSLIQRAMQLDAKVGLQGCELLRDYHWRNGRQDEAHAWHQQFVEQTQRQQAAEKERSQITLRDKFEPHDLSESVLLELRDQLRAIPGIRKAYYLKKNVKHFTHRPCYVLGFSVIGSFQLYRQKRVRDALQAIKTTVQFPGETLILNIDGDNYRFGRKFRWIRGAQVL